jgi:hypothetical protein
LGNHPNTVTCCRVEQIEPDATPIAAAAREAAQAAELEKLFGDKLDQAPMRDQYGIEGLWTGQHR